jgi:hypothetical protein
MADDIGSAGGRVLADVGWDGWQRAELTGAL